MRGEAGIERIERLERELGELRDRAAVRDVLDRYARGLDRHDRALQGSTIWDDAQLNYATAFSGPKEPFLSWGYEFIGKLRVVAHQHHITTQTIAIDGATAHAESYVLWVMRTEDAQIWVGSARYIDRLEKRAGEWRILVRELMTESNFVAASTWKAAEKPAPARWDETDLSYARPLPRRSA